ncbi:phosphoesterase [Sulfurimonas sp.]|uniref:DHH family phosphoesterase n=1 Tax=Sulfurimonas sp. TaxID=2022749 RepID=UPI0025F3F6FE|nr:phosphoesterase [Sulfurimonas sp.]
MNNFLDEIAKAKYILIVADVQNLPGASALYTHILRLHKKVSLVCEATTLDKRLSFLPWFDKIKSTKISSADFIIELDISCFELFNIFNNNNIKINTKMATALYSGLLQESNGFLNSNVNGTFFASIEQLIECGADYKTCNNFIMKRTTLAALRLKAIMLQNMLLQNNSKAAVFCISNDDLKSTGTTLKDCSEALDEALKLPYVEQSVLLDTDNENEILKIIVKEI